MTAIWRKPSFNFETEMKYCFPLLTLLTCLLKICYMSFLFQVFPYMFLRSSGKKLIHFQTAMSSKCKSHELHAVESYKITFLLKKIHIFCIWNEINCRVCSAVFLISLKSLFRFKFEMPKILNGFDQQFKVSTEWTRANEETSESTSVFSFCLPIAMLLEKRQSVRPVVM